MAKKKPRPDQQEPIGPSGLTSKEHDVSQQLHDTHGPAPDTLEPDPHWVKLASEYHGHPAIEQETIYALPKQLIDVIGKHAPEFFTKEEKHFEHDLARLGGAGFFLQRRFSYPRLQSSVLEEAPAAVIAALEKRQEASAANIRELLNEDMRQSGRSEKNIHRYWEDERERNRRVESRRWGYAGWLVTDATFRSECGWFRQEWGQEVEKLGRFPRLPMSLMGQKPDPPPPESREFYAAYRLFCTRWGLEALATWDLPIPLRPQLGSPSVYHLPSLGEAGLLLLVPWYLLRDKDIRLDELAEHVRIMNAPEHLRDWLDGKPKAWGHDRFAKMLNLYIYLELCLRPRYETRLKGNTERLDYAFAGFLCEHLKLKNSPVEEAENLRKIRLEMRRRLRMLESKEGSGPEADGGSAQGRGGTKTDMDNRGKANSTLK